MLLVGCSFSTVNSRKDVEPSLGLELLQQGVHLTLRGFDAICPDNTRGPVAVEHEDQLLPFKLQLLNLGFEVRVQHL